MITFINVHNLCKIYIVTMLIVKMDKKKKTKSPSKDKKDEKKKEAEQLDEEMEEIFHPVDEVSLVDLTRSLSLSKIDASPHFDEYDYELHRRESHPCHQPLHKIYSKAKKPPKRDGSKSSKIKNKAESVPTVSGIALKTVQEESFNNSPPIMSSSEMSDKDKVQFYVGSSSSLEMPQRPSGGHSSAKVPLNSLIRNSLKEGVVSDSNFSPSLIQPHVSETLSDENVSLPSSFTESVLVRPSSSYPLPELVPLDDMKQKVTFLVGEESRDQDSTHPMKKYHSKPSRRYAVKRKHGLNSESKIYKNILEPEEAETLQIADIDDMASHRFEDPKGIRRHKIHDKSSSSKKRDDKSSAFVKKEYDHEPHELLVELYELKEHDYSDELEWRQTARWIKYEEDVEIGADRWGKPHVPPLSFHSLLKLRQCLESGAVLLDLEEKSWTNICNKIAHVMAYTDQIKPTLIESVVDILQLRHRHVKERVLPYLRRNSSGYGNLNLLGHEKSRSPLAMRTTRSKTESDVHRIINNQVDGTPTETAVLMPSSNKLNNVEATPSLRRRFTSYERNSDVTGILRRVPDDSEGAAILVGELDTLDEPAAVFVRLSEGIYIPGFLEVPMAVRFIFVLLGSTASSLDYHEIGRSFGSLMSNQEFHESAYKALERKDLLHAINRFLDTSTVVPPGNWQKQSLLPIEEIRKKSLVPLLAAKKQIKKDEEPSKEPPYDPLKRTGRCFGGFFLDVKTRYPWYLSDILDAFNTQCMASIIFIYFAALSGAITFGGLLADKTDLNIGVSECLVGSSLCGILFAILSCQPLIIIGTTGPLLLFDEILYQFTQSYSINFLSMRIWISLWTALIATIVVAFDGSTLVKFFSRFMQEIFATIISLLFIVESITKLYDIFKEHPLMASYCYPNATNSTNEEPPKNPQPNTALLSAILMLGTFFVALFLRYFRNSKFLGRSARRALGDFGVPIAIVIFVLIDYFIEDTYTETLSVPEGLSPSNPKTRGWIISPLPINPWVALGAFVAGLLIFILIFMETQICQLIISKKKLKKGTGFHFDIIIISYMSVLSAVLGSPWQCAATVRAISHVASLTVWSKTHAPGDTPHIVELKEQRLTNFVVALLVGVSVLMSPLLRKIPLPVLFGVFLYMGISSLSGIQLYERLLLIFMPVKHHPNADYVRKVRTSKMHLWTGIQVLCIGILWIIKSFLPPAFPFGLLSLVIVHSQMKRCFTVDEIRALDGEGEAITEDEEEPDFYEQIAI